MAIDLSTYHIVPGDDTELPTKLNGMMDDVETAVNSGLSDIESNLTTLSGQITTELGAAVDTVEAAGETATTAAATATTQAGIATTAANNASNSATASANSAATAAEITNISQVQTFTNPLARAVRVAMTGASSGSRGWLVADNAEINLGTGDFTLHWDGSLPSFSGATRRLLYKYESTDDRVSLSLLTSGAPIVFIVVGGVTIISATATAAIPAARNGDKIKLTASVIRETALSAGSVTFYLDGAQLGDAVTISAAATVNIDNTGPLYIGGDASVREQSQILETLMANRSLSSTEVLDLAINGPSPADIGTPGNRASNVNILQGNNSTFEGASNWGVAAATKTDNYDSGDAGHESVLRVQRTGGAGRCFINLSAVYGRDVVGKEIELEVDLKGIYGGGSVLVLLYTDPAFPVGEQHAAVTLTSGVWREGFKTTFVAQSSTVYFVINTSSGELLVDNAKIRQKGITGLWSAEHAQNDTGQVLDQIHGNHALLPSSGATRIPQNLRPVIESPSAHSWTATNEIQYVAGNQALMSSDDSFLVIDVDSDTAFDLNVGDGSDPDRFVAAYTLSVGKNRLTIANPFNDGTNRKLTVQPASSVTASITVHAEMIKERI